MNPEGGNAGASMRVDRLLVYLRFARTRSAAQGLIDARALRRNRKHVLRGAEQARIGDVLTLALGSSVRVIELLALPARRGSPAQAAAHYREVASDALDRMGQFAIGASTPVPGVLSGDPEDHS